MKIPRNAIADDQWRAIESGQIEVYRSDEAWFRLTGTGRVDCLQGLVTCDIVQPGDDSHMYGALLTSKGMIVTPLRVTRLADQILLSVPASAAAAVADVLARSLPPRLCRFEEVTAQVAWVGFYGPRASEFALQLGPPPEPGRVARSEQTDHVICMQSSVARGARGVELLKLPANDDAPSAPDNVRSGQTVLEACRIFAGVPALGTEIDEKTLPQEVRFDELGAVSYTKGCYVGQETVARVHFRGHPNRRLVLLVLDDEPAAPPVEVRTDEKLVGRMTSTAWSPDLDAWVAQAVVRREVEDGTTVSVGDTSAVVRVDRWLREP